MGIWHPRFISGDGLKKKHNYANSCSGDSPPSWWVWNVPAWEMRGPRAQETQSLLCPQHLESEVRCGWRVTTNSKSGVNSPSVQALLLQGLGSMCNMWATYCLWTKVFFLVRRELRALLVIWDLGSELLSIFLAGSKPPDPDPDLTQNAISEPCLLPSAFLPMSTGATPGDVHLEVVLW